MRVRCAAAAVHAEAAVVGHEKHDGVRREAVAVEVRHEVAEALVHTFHQRGIHRFGVVEARVAILLIKPLVRRERHMHRVVRHVKEERLPVRDGLIHRLVRLEGQRLGEEDVLAVILLQAGHVPDGRRASPRAAEILLAEITAWPACRMAGNVDVEAKVARFGAGRVERAPVRLAGVNRAVARLAEKLSQRRRADRMRRGRVRAEAVDVPRGRLERRVFRVGSGVFAERPVRDLVPRGVEAGHEADPRRRANATSVGLRELHARRGEPLHVRRVKLAVQRRDLSVKLHRRVLPAHVVHEEQHDVRRRVGGEKVRRREKHRKK